MSAGRATPAHGRLAAPLLRLRLRWYAVSTARLLLRRWQAAALIVGVLGAANASVFSNLDTFSRPLTMLLAPGHGPAWRCAWLIVLLVVAALWAGMQRAQIAGGAFMDFIGSLPFSERQRRHVDLIVLLLADSPLLLMLCAALAVTAGRRAPGAHLLTRLLFLCDLAPLALVAQLALLERRPLAWAGVLAACLLLALGFDSAFDVAAGLLAGAAACLALAMTPWPRVGRRTRVPVRADAGGHAPANRLLRLLAGRHAPALRVPLAILYRERRSEALAKAVGAAGLAAAAIGLMTLFDHDTRSLPTVLLAQGAIALTISGLFRGLHMAHGASAGYTAALPLPPRWRTRFDLLAVLGFGVPFLAAPALAGWTGGVAPPALLLAGLLSNAALLCALRVAQLASERHAVVLGTVLAGAWSAATIAATIAATSAASMGG